MRLLRVVGLAAAFFGFGGCSSDGASQCAGAPSSNCVLLIVGSAEGNYNACYDVATQTVCEAGQWKCPAGSVPVEQCDCEGNAAGDPHSCGNQPDGGASGG
jgi:hypothetical protein